MQQMPAAAGMHLYANGYRPVMDALLPLLFYCVLPCVVLKSFCIEYSEKGAVEPGCRVGLCMSLKTTNRKQEIG